MSEKRLPSPYSVRVALAALRGYQLCVRPLLTGQCRYLPTCSEYAAESIATFGVGRGGWMSLKRLLRCHPLGGSGVDPVPLVPSTRRAVSRDDSRCSLGTDPEHGHQA